ncbi:MAG: hypothetical protein K8F91_22920, partial [Candidatus Obscuribacterales bacterium]|nr:hypothetical protein [Candidatus Obscuribacterales bacterium]
QAGVVEVESKLLSLMELLGDFRECPVEDSTLEKIKEQNKQACQLISIKGRSNPLEIVETLDQYLESKRTELAENPDRLVSQENALAETSILLGSMWGEQLILEFGWLWSSVEIGSTRILCIVSPDRSLVIYPCHFIASCLFDEEIDCTIMLAFNMMKDGLGDMPANGFENVMDGVFRMDTQESAAPAN